MAIYGGLNNIYGYTKKRNWLITRVLAFFYNILFIVAVVVSVVVLVFGNALISFIDTEFIFAHYILTVVFKLKYLIFFILFVLVFAAVYTFLPQRKLRYKKQFVGALAAASGWIAFSYGFSVYIKHFSKFSFLYGSITAVVILMLWVYFCQYMFLIGAEINKHIETGYFRKIKNKL
jgi:membrane protein